MKSTATQVFLSLTIVFFACKKDVNPDPNASSFNKKLLVNHWWYTDYSRTDWMAEYKGRYFKEDSTSIVDQTNFGLSITNGGRWWWTKKDTLLFGETVKGVVKNLTTDSLAVYWIWTTIPGVSASGFTAYYSK